MEENKFNFTEDDSTAQKKVVEEQKEAIVKDAKGLVSNSKQFLYGIDLCNNCHAGLAKIPTLFKAIKISSCLSTKLSSKIIVCNQ